MRKSIYLINPAADMPSYFSAESLAGRGLPRAISTADLSIALVAAMVPDGLDVALCDENITSIDFDAPPTMSASPARSASGTG